MFLPFSFWNCVRTLFIDNCCITHTQHLVVFVCLTKTIAFQTDFLFCCDRWIDAVLLIVWLSNWRDDTIFSVARIDNEFNFSFVSQKWTGRPVMNDWMIKFFVFSLVESREVCARACGEFECGGILGILVFDGFFRLRTLDPDWIVEKFRGFD